jgi:hypothetical protein
MSDPEGSRLDLSQVFERFPEDVARIRRLVLADDSFAGICEDYALARTTLARLEQPGEAEGHGEEVADYRTLVADLEREVAEALRHAG